MRMHARMQAGSMRTCAEPRVCPTASLPAWLVCVAPGSMRGTLRRRQGWQGLTGLPSSDGSGRPGTTHPELWVHHASRHIIMDANTTHRKTKNRQKTVSKQVESSIYRQFLAGICTSK